MTEEQTNVEKSEPCISTKKNILLAMPTELYTKLKTEAKEKKMSMSALIRSRL